MTAEGRLAHASIRSRSNFSFDNQTLTFTRSEQGLRGALEVPIASRQAGFLPALGELSATAEYARVHFSDAGLMKRESVALVWTPLDALRLRAAREHVDTPAPIELLGSPVIVTPDVRIFDVLTGETVDVVAVSGGNPHLLPQSSRETRLSAILRLVPRLGLELNGDYVDSDQRNFVSGLPPASTAIMAAFPDRFTRDATGTLVRVDVRPVNFARHEQRRLRYGFTLNAPLSGGGAAGLPTVGDEAADAAAAAAANLAHPAWRLQITANDTMMFSDKIVIREGLEPVDLLSGGAIGIGGSSLHHLLDATVGITSGGTGMRLGAVWRGSSTLQTRTDGLPNMLHFSPLLQLNLRAFADLHRFLPHSSWSKSARVALNVVNLTDKRQKVRDSFGNTPLQYQPAYRDPLGRTIEVELRKVF